MTLAPGTTLGRYQILEPLGSGGMATVYKAYEPSLDRVVALKVIRPGLAEEEGFLARFRREAQAVAKLSHPNIVQVFSFDESDGRYFLAMQYLDGGTLKDRIGTLEPGTLLDPAETTSIIAQVADALTYAHSRGVVHRDIKPSNIMLAEGGRAVVTDFGIAKIVSAAQLTQTGVGIGTPEYMAPEQGAGGQVDARADVYSLAVVAYELLVGRVPYLADTPFAIVAAHMRDPLPLPTSINPALPAAAERALLKALAKQPAQRFDRATDFAEALRDGLAADSAGGTMPTIVVRAPTAVAVAEPTRAAVRDGRPLHALTSLPRTLAARPAVAAAIAVTLLVVIGGGVLFAGATRSGVTSAGPTASPVAASAIPAPSQAPPTPLPSLAPLTAIPTTPTPTPKFAVPAKGKLLFEAKLDGTATDLRFAPTKFGDASATDFRLLPGAIELSVLKDQPPSADLNYVRAEWRSGVLQTYVCEYDLAFAPGSRSRLDATLRISRGVSAYRLRLDAEAQMLYLYYVPFDAEGKVGPLQTLGSRVPVSELQSGALTLAVAVEANRFTVYVNQKQVLQVSDTRIDQSTGSPYLDLEWKQGTLRITGARFYGLPSP